MTRYEYPHYHEDLEPLFLEGRSLMMNPSGSLHRYAPNQETSLPLTSRFPLTTTLFYLALFSTIAIVAFFFAIPFLLSIMPSYRGGEMLATTGNTLACVWFLSLGRNFLVYSYLALSNIGRIIRGVELRPYP